MPDILNEKEREGAFGETEPLPMDHPMYPSARLREGLQPKPPSGGSAVKIPPGTARYVAESDARREFYEAMTDLVRGVSPALIALATILTEAAKKESKP